MFFKKNNSNALVEILYNKIVLHSRDKHFYLNLKVPDTIDGRFDMLLLFTIIVVYKLSSIKSVGQEIAQNLFDRLFLDLDYSLREIGAGDVGVSSKIKIMASAYLGRQDSYCFSFKNNDLKFFVNSLNNNVYRNVLIEDHIVKSLAIYCFNAIDKLNSYKDDEILSGCFDFPTINN